MTLECINLLIYMFGALYHSCVETFLSFFHSSMYVSIVPFKLKFSLQSDFTNIIIYVVTSISTLNGLDDFINIRNNFNFLGISNKSFFCRLKSISPPLHDQLVLF